AGTVRDRKPPRLLARSSSAFSMRPTSPGRGHPAGAIDNERRRDVPLEHLFDAELQYRPDVEPVVGSEGREGELIGSVDGAVTGVRLAGRLRWSRFAADCPFRPDGFGGSRNGDPACPTNPALALETDEGATI